MLRGDVLIGLDRLKSAPKLTTLMFEAGDNSTSISVVTHLPNLTNLQVANAGRISDWSPIREVANLQIYNAAGAEPANYLPHLTATTAYDALVGSFPGRQFGRVCDELVPQLRRLRIREQRGEDALDLSCLETASLTSFWLDESFVDNIRSIATLERLVDLAFMNSEGHLRLGDLANLNALRVIDVRGFTGPIEASGLAAIDHPLNIVVDSPSQISDADSIKGSRVRLTRTYKQPAGAI